MRPTIQKTLRAFDLPGRSVVHSQSAMIATSHPLATSAGLDILKRGGTAMDAAIAASAVLAVVEPAETGIGGDCFALYAPKGALKPIGFNGSGRAPAGLALEQVQNSEGGAIAATSPHAVTLPGAVDAWCQLHERFGKLELAELLSAAIGYARDGHPVHERVAREWRNASDRLEHDGETKRVFLPDGAPPSVGSVFRNAALAESLEAIAREGREAFYEGPLARAMVKHLNALGGVHTLEDFAEVRGEFIEPISEQYRDRQVFQLPPNTQGAIALLLLKLGDAFGVKDLPFLSPERIRLLADATRAAIKCRDELIGDTDTSASVLEKLSDERWLSSLAASIASRRGNEGLADKQHSTGNTVYITVVDRDRNVASFINSVFESFGSGLTPPGTGVLLQNRGRGFSLEPGHPNAVAGRRRPMHTIIPALVGADDKVELSYGVVGGSYQPLGHAHILSAIYDYGYGIQAAIDAPRFMAAGNKIEIESGIPASVVEALAAEGCCPIAAPTPHGGAQLIHIDWSAGTLSAASDPRKDGLALGY